MRKNIAIFAKVTMFLQHFFLRLYANQTEKMPTQMKSQQQLTEKVQEKNQIERAMLFIYN